MLLLLSRWTYSRGTEATLVTGRQEILASCLKLMLDIISLQLLANNLGLKAVKKE